MILRRRLVRLTLTAVAIAVQIAFPVGAFILQVGDVLNKLGVEFFVAAKGYLGCGRLRFLNFNLFVSLGAGFHFDVESFSLPKNKWIY